VDILLHQASVLHLPSSKRASVIVYDGTQDLGLWRPPGPDRDLWDAYGDELRAVLDKEKKRLPKGQLPIGGALRLHPGKLHCDFLLWVASRPPHGETAASPAPSVAVVEDSARRAIEFVAEHDVVRVAFSALGAGKGEAPAAERMAAVVRAVAAYKEACFTAERPSHVEEVVVCDPSGENVAKARRLAPKLAKTAYLPPPAPAAPAPKERAARSVRPPRAAGTGTTGRHRGPPRLKPEDVAAARARAYPYDRARCYSAGAWLIHPVFGVGQVQLVKPERMVAVLFENGEEKTLIHDRV
jgi:O-acetyl-ADP-ribose deacetylase (regulator of RNase III)